MDEIVAFWACPECGYRVMAIEKIQLRIDVSCPRGCGVKLSDFTCVSEMVERERLV